MSDTLINQDSDILGGTPVLRDTRAHVRILIDYLEAGDPLDEFLENHPIVPRRQVVGLLKRVRSMLDRRLVEAAA